MIRMIPNAITCITVFCGFLLMVSTSVPGISPEVCVFATLAGLVADVLDGQAARVLRVKSAFGATFDQLADLTCFGIGPGIFYTRQALSGTSFSFNNLMVLVAGYTYVVCSVWRITRELIVHSGARHLYFVGIPTNLACCVMVPLAAWWPQMALAPLFVLLLSTMMVMRVQIPKGLGIVRVTESQVTSACNQRSQRGE